MQEDLLKLVLAISEGRGEDAGDIVAKVGQPMHDADPVELRRRVSERVIQFQGLRIKDIALGRLLSALMTALKRSSKSPRKRVPASSAPVSSAKTSASFSTPCTSS